MVAATKKTPTKKQELEGAKKAMKAILNPRRSHKQLLEAANRRKAALLIKLDIENTRIRRYERLILTTNKKKVSSLKAKFSRGDVLTEKETKELQAILS